MAESGNLQRRFDLHDADWVCLVDERKNTAEPLVGWQIDFRGPAGVKYLQSRKQSGWHTDWLTDAG